MLHKPRFKSGFSFQSDMPGALGREKMRSAGTSSTTRFMQVFKLLPSRLLATVALLSISAACLLAQNVSTLVSVVPCRIIDSRNATGPFGGPTLAAQGVRDIPIPSSSCSIPSNALAYSVNVTVVPHGPLSYLTMWPTGQTMPLASTLNAYTGAVTANAAIVPAGANGSISVFVTDSTELIIDINGYFVAQALPVMPTIPPFPTIPNVISQSTSSVTQNTAIGNGASSTGGAQNTAVGSNALAGNSSGVFNTALGSGALAANVSGNENTAIGTNSLSNSASGAYNAALGSHSLENNSIGNGNTAVGYFALSGNTTGIDNVGVGINALQSVSSGIENIGIGTAAGTNITNGSYNLDIASPGMAGDSGVIRIGNTNHNSVYLAGVYGNSAANGLPLVMNSSGRLGTTTSSRRYKEDIREIGDVSLNIFKLRPVQFRYKQSAEDGSKPLQYGLIAEEVEAVYPQLVVHDKDGQPEGVQYQQLPALLLNEIQRQQKTISGQQEQIQELMRRIANLEAQSSGALPADRQQN